MAVIGNAPFQGLVSGGNILDASIEGVDLSTSAIAARLGYTPVDPGAAVFSANPTISSGTANTVAFLNGSKVVSGSSNLTFNGTVLTVADLADSSLTAGRVVYAGTGGNLVDSANLTFSGQVLNITNNTALVAGQNALSVNSGNNMAFGIASTGEAYVANTASSRYQYYQAGTIGSINANSNSVNSAALIDINAYNSSNGATNIYFGAVAGATGNGPANFVIGRRIGATSWAESLRVDTSGRVLINSQTAIYTNSKLQVTGTTGPSLGAQQTTATEYAGGFWNNAASNVKLIAFYAGSTGAIVGEITATSTSALNINGVSGSGITIDNSSYVGINKATPRTEFDVSGRARFNSYLAIGRGPNNNDGIFWNITPNTSGTAYTPGYTGSSGAGSAYLGMPSGGNGGLMLKVKRHGTSTTDYAESGMTMSTYWDDSGNVAIGNTSPQSKLHVTGDVNQSVSFTAGADATGAIAYINSELRECAFNVNNTSNFRISNITTSATSWRAVFRGTWSNNYEGGGLTSPAPYIEVNAANNTITVGSRTLTVSRDGSGYLIVNCNDTYRIAFTGSIEIYDNTQSGQPTNSIVTLGAALISKNVSSVSVAGHTLGAGGYTYHTYDGGNVMWLNRLTNNGDIQIWQQGNSDKLAAGTYNGSPYIGGATGSTSAGFMFNGASVEPTYNGGSSRNNASVDFGSQNYRWKRGYFVDFAIGTTTAPPGNGLIVGGPINAVGGIVSDTAVHGTIASNFTGQRWLLLDTISSGSGLLLYGDFVSASYTTELITKVYIRKDYNTNAVSATLTGVGKAGTGQTCYVQTVTYGGVNYIALSTNGGDPGWNASWTGFRITAVWNFVTSGVTVVTTHATY